MDQARYDYIIITRNTDKIKTAVFHLLLLLFFGSGREMVVLKEHSLVRFFCFFSCVFFFVFACVLLLLYSYCGHALLSIP